MTEDDYVVVREISDLKDFRYNNPDSQAKHLFLPRITRDGRRFHGDIYVTQWATQHPDWPRIELHLKRELALMRKGGVVKCLAS